MAAAIGEGGPTQLIVEVGIDRARNMSPLIGLASDLWSRQIKAAIYDNPIWASEVLLYGCGVDDGLEGHASGGGEALWRRTRARDSGLGPFTASRLVWMCQPVWGLKDRLASE
jgi:hypothetical protein